jgi:competence protein ComEC
LSVIRPDVKGASIALLFLYIILLLSQLKCIIKVFINLIIAFVVIIASLNHVEQFHNHSVKTDVNFKGNLLIESKPKLINNRLFFIGKLENKLKVNVTVENCNSCENITLGKYVYSEGVIRPINSTKNFAGFNREVYLKDRHFIGTLVITNKIYELEYSSSYITKLISFRNRVIDNYNKYSDHISIGFILALVVGDRNLLSDETQTLFQQFGLVHLIAISGMQVHILTFGLYKLLIWCGLTKEKSQVALFILQPIICILTGMSPSVIRSTFTTGLYLFTKITKLKLMNIETLAISFAILLLYEPFYLLDIGFQLSYVNSIALILSIKLLQEQNYLKTLFRASVICQLASLPIVISNFYELSLLSVPLNIGLIPLINLIIFPISLILFILLPAIGEFNIHFNLLRPTDYILEKIMYLLKLLDKNYNPMFVFPKSNIMLILLESILISLTLYYIELKENFKSKLVICLMILVFIFHTIQPQINANYTVTMLDVGQGDCILIQSSYNKETIVVDTGGNFLAKNDKFMVNSIIVPTLKSQGVSRIDYLIITHGDYDHAGNTIETLKKFKVKNIILGAKKNLTSLEKDVINFAKQNKIKIHSINNSNKIVLSNGIIEILTPYTDDLEGNSSSITFILSSNKFNLLFMGDLEYIGEEWLTNNYKLPVIDVLKVSHHGSKGATSDKFLQAIKPKLALISAGKNNLYKHPHKETLQRLRTINSKIYRTDSNGAIKLDISEKSVTIFTARP